MLTLTGSSTPSFTSSVKLSSTLGLSAYGKGRTFKNFGWHSGSTVNSTLIPFMLPNSFLKTSLCEGRYNFLLSNSICFHKVLESFCIRTPLLTAFFKRTHITDFVPCSWTIYSVTYLNRWLSSTWSTSSSYLSFFRFTVTPHHFFIIITHTRVSESSEMRRWHAVIYNGTATLLYFFYVQHLTPEHFLLTRLHCILGIVVK